MRIIALPPLTAFWNKYPEAEMPLRAWIAHVRQADWQTPADVKSDFSSASIIGNSRVVFNIKGNRYRLVTAILYAPRIVMIKFVGTHEEYDNVDVETIELP